MHIEEYIDDDERYCWYYSYMFMFVISFINLCEILIHILFLHLSLSSLSFLLLSLFLAYFLGAFCCFHQFFILLSLLILIHCSIFSKKFSLTPRRGSEKRYAYWSEKYTSGSIDSMQTEFIIEYLNHLSRCSICQFYILEALVRE